MLQALINNGKVLAQTVPDPIASKGSVLIKVQNSCISAGTEMSSLKSSDESLLIKLIKNPDYIKKGLDYLKEEGLTKLIGKVNGEAGIGSATGYSISGTIVEVGDGVNEFKVGDRVAAAGAGIANHAEFVDVPVNLVMHIPSNLDYKLASTVTLGGIAMQGVRRANTSIGEFVVVVGAGILGLISIQLLKVAGVRVIAVDIDDYRLGLASEYGAELVINSNKDNSIEIVENYTGGHLADVVIFTANTSSSEPLSNSFKMIKKKGKLILVGVSGMELKREDIYVKELDFQISTSYGPGRYDRNYEEKGLDYPYSYVRWTENRNMAEYLRLLSTNCININSMINGVYSIENVEDAYNALQNKVPRPLLVLLEYNSQTSQKIVYQTESNLQKNNSNNRKVESERIRVAIIGTGSFATGMHLPNLNKLSSKFEIHAICSRTASKSKSVAMQYNAKYSTVDPEQIINDPEVDLVMICTRHDSHAELVLKCLKANKNVFVEKPLAINILELNDIKEFYSQVANKNLPSLYVGYNRRFSKYLREINNALTGRISPLVINYRMNAGFVTNDSWIHDDGGRIIGEACHIIDLMHYLTKSEVISVSVESMGNNNSKYSTKDNKIFILKYLDGSICNINYFSCGSKLLSKEFLELHFDGKSIIMDDYKSLKGFGINLAELNSNTSQKGQFEELEYLYDHLRGITKELPISYQNMFQTSEISFLIS
jgi:predicted dehydrogenase/threonine dehydrogenase-like Zn-dependent dehydrogenase